MAAEAAAARAEEELGRRANSEPPSLEAEAAAAGGGEAEEALSSSRSAIFLGEQTLAKEGALRTSVQSKYQQISRSNKGSQRAFLCQKPQNERPLVPALDRTEGALGTHLRAQGQPGDPICIQNVC